MFNFFHECLFLGAFKPKRSDADERIATQPGKTGVSKAGIQKYRFTNSAKTDLYRVSGSETEVFELIL